MVRVPCSVCHMLCVCHVSCGCPVCVACSMYITCCVCCVFCVCRVPCHAVHVCRTLCEWRVFCVSCVPCVPCPVCVLHVPRVPCIPCVPCVPCVSRVTCVSCVPCVSRVPRAPSLRAAWEGAWPRCRDRLRHRLCPPGVSGPESSPLGRSLSPPKVNAVPLVSLVDARSLQPDLEAAPQTQRTLALPRARREAARPVGLRQLRLPETDDVPATSRCDFVVASVPGVRRRAPGSPSPEAHCGRVRQPGV